MKIILRFKGQYSGKERKITNDCMVSPSGGYTQSYADKLGKDYEGHRAQEIFGDDDMWKFVSAEYLDHRRW